MPTPRLYRKSQEAAIASYNYTDLASGSGFVNMYAGVSVDKKKLSPYEFWSDRVATGTANVTTTSGYELQTDTDFDLEFLKPQIIEGETIINVPVGYHALSDGAALGIYVICKVRKWDGTTETELASNTSTTLATTDSDIGTTEAAVMAIDVDIPRTHFKAGEFLRLTIEMYASVSAAATAHFFYGHDPKARYTTLNETEDKFDFGTTWMTNAISSILLFQVPFRIDI